jgi:hypothetical protein
MTVHHIVVKDMRSARIQELWKLLISKEKTEALMKSNKVPRLHNEDDSKYSNSLNKAVHEKRELSSLYLVS